MKHTLHVIGWLGIKTAYLDITLEEAKQRYMESNSEGTPPEDVDTFQFDDEFAVYDAWPNEVMK